LRTSGLLTKSARLAIEIVRDPPLIATLGSVARNSVRSNWCRREPWWNSRAVSYLEHRLPVGGSVFEWGSGGSTAWFSDHGLEVTAVESEIEWAERVRHECPDVNLIFVPGADSGYLRSESEFRDRGRHFFDDYVAIIDQCEDSSLDVIVVDGLCRVECAKRCVPKIKPGGVIIIDDTNFTFVSSAGEPFETWRSYQARGFKRPGFPVFETQFFWAPA
jgi:hypothetical protein